MWAAPAANGTTRARSSEEAIVRTLRPKAAGTYLVGTRARGRDGELRILHNGQRVGQYRTSNGWRRFEAVVTVQGPNDRVDVEVRGGRPRATRLERVPAGFAVRGNRILDLEGSPIVFRGVNKPSLEQTPEGWYWHSKDVGAIQEWGATIVRVPLSQQFWLPDSCEFSVRYRESVDRAVQLITGRGMVALLNLHLGSGGGTCGQDMHRMADTRSVRFWQEVALRYRGNQLVAFDLYNEPWEVSPEVWRDGGPVRAWQAAGMQDLYNAVRRTGARNLVFVSGLRWAFDPRVALTHRLDGYGIVYAAHVYSEDEQLTGEIDDALLDVAAADPLVITEFGTKLGTGTYNERLIAYAEQHRLGWVAWAWGAGDPREWVILESWESHEPNVAGQPVRDGLRAARERGR